MISSPFQSAEGIILKVIPFRDYDQILVIFTQEAGLIKVLTKKNRSKKGAKDRYMPLTKVEVIYQEKQGEIFNCQEVAILDIYRNLRTELSHLQVACDLLQILYQTQLLGKPAPQLFALVEFFLKKIPQTKFPDILTLSFRLKLLKHEGILTSPLVCSVCVDALNTLAFFYKGEWFCPKHYPFNSSALDEKELKIFYHLLDSKHYQDLAEMSIFPQTKIKIEKYFKESMQK
jgi:DNA repair protein RecO (recombination protein O)